MRLLVVSARLESHTSGYIILPRVPPRSIKMVSPLGQGGLQGGFERGNKPNPALRSRLLTQSARPPHPWPLSRVGERGTEVHHVPSHDNDFSAFCALMIKHKFLSRQYCPRKIFN